jgi:hypothetical protein
MMDVQPIKCQKRLILHPIDNTEPPTKKIRYEPFETSQVVFATELKSRKSKRSHVEENIELQNNQNFDNFQPQSKVQKTNYHMNPHKETSNGFFDNSEISNSRKRKLDDNDGNNFQNQEKYVKTNNNSDIELAQKLPNTFKIHIEPDANQMFLGNSLSNHSGAFHSPQHHQHHQSYQQEDDINMEISPDLIYPTAEYVRINSVLNDYYYERLARGKHVHATSPTKKFWSPEFHTNAKGLNL